MRIKVNASQPIILLLMLMLCTHVLLHSQCIGDNTFTGDTDNCWSTPSNWSAGCVPCGDTIIGVIIIAADCIVKASNSTNCFFGNGATLAIEEGVTLTNNSTGEWSVFHVLGSGTYEGDLPIYGGVKPGNAPPSPPVWITCGDPLEYDGQSYTTVQIGGQCWMAENLNVGIMIFDDTYIAADNGVIEKHCYDDNIFNCTTYGGLYQWEELMEYSSTESAQGICPTDWHIPSDDDFKALEIYLLMTPTQANAYGERGTDQGSQMGGDEPLWLDGNLDQNIAFGTSGFTAIPGGHRGADAGFFQPENAFFWTSSNDGFLKWVRGLFQNNSTVFRYSAPPETGYSVRCIHD